MSTLRTLVVTPNLPYPTFSGVDLRNWQNINGLTSVGQVGVFGLCANDPRCGEAPLMSLALWRSSTDPALTYPPSQGQKLAARAWLLDPLGHPSDLYYSDTAAAELTAVVTAFRPQIVVLEGLWLHRYIDLLKHHNCRVVLDCHNVEAALSQQIGDSASGSDLQARLLREILPTRVKRIEQHATHTVDQLWVCSNYDARLLREQYEPPVPIHTVPNGVNTGSYAEARARQYRPLAAVDPTKRPLIFPAMFAYPPNAGAATFLITEFFSRLVTICTDCQLLLVGSFPSPQMIEAARRDPRIVVTGPVPDIRPYLAAASAMVVPIFQGSGTRFKILEAFAANVPVISTTKGTEGLDIQDGTHLLIAESAGDFVAAVQQLWADENLAKKLTANGLELVKQLYSWDVTSLRIGKAINELNHPKI